jgi:hypothetical protein
MGDALERQSNFRVNDRTKHRGRGFGSSVSVSLSHAKVAREKKPPEKPPNPSPQRQLRHRSQGTIPGWPGECELR